MARQQQEHNDHMSMFALVFAAVAVILAIKFLTPPLTEFYLKMKYWEINFLLMIFNDEQLKFYKYFLETCSLEEWVAKSCAAPRETYELIDGKMVSNQGIPPSAIGRYMFFNYFIYIALPIFGGLAYFGYKKGPSVVDNYKKRFNMKTLAKSQKDIWPWITPVLNLDLIKEDITKGKWAMSKTVKNFTKTYNLLEEDNTVNTNRATKLFIAQLGRLWSGVENLRPYEKALFAAFIAHGIGDKDAALDGLSKLANAGVSNIDWADKLIKKYINNEHAQRIIKNHAYVSTVLCSALQFARTSQTLPSSYFIWLKPMDRGLWYSLNGVGRRVSFCEVAGVSAHWFAELVAGHAIEKPYIIEAVNGLKEAVKGINFD